MESATENPAIPVRRARPGEEGLLSDLALRSKGLWGYDAKFLEGCRELLTISRDDIVSLPIFVLEKDGRVVGFYGLRQYEQDVELLYLFVEPVEVHHGYGKLLWNHAIKFAERAGYRRVLIESDPNAEEFYLAMGARRTSETISPLDPSRILPLMAFPLDLLRSKRREANSRTAGK